MNIPRNARLEELEKRFSSLEPRLKDSPEKEALSILYAMIHESRKAVVSDGSASVQRGGPNFEDIANLYRTAPGMEGVAESQGLKPGFPAPDFSLKDAQARAISLQEFRGKNVVLAFYPLDWSPACSDQLSLYQSELNEFKKFNTQVLAISVDNIYSHGAWAAVRGIDFPLLADFHPKGEIAQRYKVYRNSDGFSERALYVIDPGGVIRFCTISPELHKIPDIYALFDQLQQLQDPAVSGQQG